MPNINEYEYNYQKHDDFYCYPNTTILINKFNIREKEELNAVERRITTLKIAGLEKNHIKGTFDLKHLKSIHKFIFGDIYDWAGQIRKGDFLIKGDSIFCRAMFIESMAADIHAKLKADNFLRGFEKTEFINKLAYYIGEINALHPFREGNGRTQRLYFEFLSFRAGYELDFTGSQKNVLVKADIAAFNREYTPLIEILNNIVDKKKRG
jgi:cell filamentation protein